MLATNELLLVSICIACAILSISFWCGMQTEGWMEGGREGGGERERLLGGSTGETQYWPLAVLSIGVADFSSWERRVEL